MGDRKRSKGEHVTLSKETVRKLLSTPEPAGGLYLDPWDVLALERAERLVKETHAAATETRLRLAVLNAEHERLLHMMTQEQTERASRLTEAKEAVAKLADTLAARYCIDWNTHTFNPETGEISRID